MLFLDISGSSSSILALAFQIPTTAFAVSQLYFIISSNILLASLNNLLVRGSAALIELVPCRSTQTTKKIFAVFPRTEIEKLS